MKSVLICFLTFLSCFGMADPLSDFLKRHPETIYQDIFISGQNAPIGTDQCAVRYELLRPVLDRFEGPFSVLDLGAAQGYFSFNIAHDYPMSQCLMIDANTQHYLHGDLLAELTQLNSDLTNITHLNKLFVLEDLIQLRQTKHFDLLFAFLVVHQIDAHIDQQMKIIQTLLALADTVIIEVANDVAVPLSSYVEFLSHKIDCQYLGEVKRHKDPKSTSMGKLFCFRGTSSIDPSRIEALPENQNLKRLEKKILKYTTNSWCSREKTHLIVKLIAATRPQVIVEIGAFSGSSTLPMLATAKEIGQGHVFVIEPWSNREAIAGLPPGDPHTAWWASVDMKWAKQQFATMLSRWSVADQCTLIVSTSREALSQIGAIDFLHLDGNFSEEGAQFDTDHYLPKVKPGGYILISNLLATKLKALWPLFETCTVVGDVDLGSSILFRNGA